MSGWIDEFMKEGGSTRSIDMGNNNATEVSELAAEFGRRVAIQLDRRNWDGAKAVIDAARIEFESSVDLLDTPLEDAVHPRTAATLAREFGAVTLRDLVDIPPEYMAAAPNMGITRVREITQALAAAKQGKNHE